MLHSNLGLVGGRDKEAAAPRRTSAARMPATKGGRQGEGERERVVASTRKGSCRRCLGKEVEEGGHFSHPVLHVRVLGRPLTPNALCEPVTQAIIC